MLYCIADKSGQEFNNKQKRDQSQKQKKNSIKKSSSSSVRSRKYDNEDETSQEVPDAYGRLETHQKEADWKQCMIWLKIICIISDGIILEIVKIFARIINVPNYDKKLRVVLTNLVLPRRLE